jgi:hypothetical protein
MEPAVKRWLERPLDQRMPLLLCAPPQTGKKTAVRNALKAGGYSVVEPSNRVGGKWDFYKERGMYGPLAYLMSVAETGLRALPKSIGNAPVVYVTCNMHDHGKKATLEKKYHIMEIRGATSKKAADFGQAHDQDLAPWLVFGAIGKSSKLDMDESMRAIEMGTDGLLQNLVRINLYGKTPSNEDYNRFCDKKYREECRKSDCPLEKRRQCVQALRNTANISESAWKMADLLSLSDLAGYDMPTDQKRYLDTVLPSRMAGLHTLRQLEYRDEQPGTTLPPKKPPGANRKQQTEESTEQKPTKTRRTK